MAAQAGIFDDNELDGAHLLHCQGNWTQAEHDPDVLQGLLHKNCKQGGSGHSRETPKQRALACRRCNWQTQYRHGRRHRPPPGSRQHSLQCQHTAQGPRTHAAALSTGCAMHFPTHRKVRPAAVGHCRENLRLGTAGVLCG